MFASHLYKNSGFTSDPNFNNVSLLLHGDGTSGAQNNTFLDSSTNNFTITRNGTPTQGSFSPFSLNGEYSIVANGGSGYFNGTTDYLTIPANTNFAFGTGDFTIEAWVNPRVSSFGSRLVTNRRPLQGQAGTWSFTFNSSGIQFSEVVVPENPIQGNYSFIPNNWYHICVTRTSGTIRLFVNGNIVGTGTLATNFNNSSYALYIASSPQETYTPAYISNLRIIKGTAIYTSNFIPPTSPVTAVANTSLLCNFTNAGIFDNAAKNNLITFGNSRISTIQKKFGTGSILFNGSTDYCRTLALAGTHQFGTGDFTIECWAYCTNLAGGSSNAMEIIDFRSSTNNEVRPTLAILNSQFLYFTNGSNRIVSSTISANTWYHVAVVRSSGSTKLYVNGTNVGVTYTDANNYLDGTPTIGNYLPSPIYGFAGYIDDVRITKGIARYTANFTPPTQAFPNL